MIYCFIFLKRAISSTGASVAWPYMKTIESFRDALIANGYQSIARAEKWDILLGHIMLFVINTIPRDLLPQDVQIDYEKLLANLEALASSGYADEMVEAWEILGLLYASDPNVDEKTLKRGAWYVDQDFFSRVYFFKKFIWFFFFFF
jgi:hypothetical protein